MGTRLGLRPIDCRKLDEGLEVSATFVEMFMTHGRDIIEVCDGDKVLGYIVPPAPVMEEVGRRTADTMLPADKRPTLHERTADSSSAAVYNAGTALIADALIARSSDMA